MGGGTGAKAGGVQGLPLAARAKDEEDGFHADAVGGPRPAAAEAVRVFVFGEKQSDAFPKVVRDVPLVHDGPIRKSGVIHGCTSCAQLPTHNARCSLQL
jgi:hypothetical protein